MIQTVADHKELVYQASLAYFHGAITLEQYQDILKPEFTSMKHTLSDTFINSRYSETLRKGYRDLLAKHGIPND